MGILISVSCKNVKKEIKKSEMKMDKTHKRLIELLEFVLVTFMPLKESAV